MQIIFNAFVKQKLKVIYKNLFDLALMMVYLPHTHLLFETQKISLQVWHLSGNDPYEIIPVHLLSVQQYIYQQNDSPDYRLWYVPCLTDSLRRIT